VNFIREFLFHFHFPNQTQDPEPAKIFGSDRIRHRLRILIRNTADWILICGRIRIGIQPKMLDPDPESMNPDPKHPMFFK
jgi:hypothetical protein